MAERQPAARRRVHLAPRLWAALPVLLLALVGVSGAQAAQAAPQARSLAPHDPTFTIVNPTGSSGPSGPVGTYVTAKISGASKGQVYEVAYVDATASCSAPGASPSYLARPTVGDGGSVQFSFQWPASSGQGTFSLCAKQTPAPLIGIVPTLTSQQPFTVLSTTPPAITIQPAPQPTPTGTTTGAGGAAGPQDSYTIGESVVVQGTGFLPGGTSVQISLASSPNGDGTQLSQGAVNADTSGNFTTTVTLPSFRVGPQLFIQAITTDGGNNQPPSLRASTPIAITLAPTATPQPTATVTPTPAATSTTAGGTPGGSPGSGGNGGTLRILGIAGLGSFSILLFLVGAALLISAGGGREP